MQNKAYNTLDCVRRTNCTTRYRAHKSRGILGDNESESIEPIDVSISPFKTFAEVGADISHKIPDR